MNTIIIKLAFLAATITIIQTVESMEKSHNWGSITVTQKGTTIIATSFKNMGQTALNAKVTKYGNGTYQEEGYIYTDIQQETFTQKACKPSCELVTFLKTKITQFEKQKNSLEKYNLY